MMHLMASSYLTPPPSSITRLGGITALATNTASFNVDVTSLGLQTGDIVLVGAVNGNLTSAQTFAAYGDKSGAFTQVASIYANGTDDTTLYVGMLEVGSTPDTFVTVTLGTQNRYPIALVAYRGVDGTTGLDVAATNASGTASGQPNPPAITPSTAGSKIVAFYGASHNVTGSPDWTAPANLNHFLQLSDSTNRPHIGTGDADWGSGAFDPAAVTGGNTSTSDSWAGVTLALRPGPPGSGSAGYGPELISNGGFTSNSTGWTTSTASAAVSGGHVTVATTGTTGLLYQAITTVVGATYRVQYDATNGTGTATVEAGDNTTAGVLSSGAAGTSGVFTFVADVTTTYIHLKVAGGSGKTGIFDNVSVKRVL